MVKAKTTLVYMACDGRRRFAVAALSRAAAVRRFNAVADLRGVNTTNQRTHGYVWQRGQVALTDVIFDAPGVVFQESTDGRSPHPWFIYVETSC